MFTTRQIKNLICQNESLNGGKKNSFLRNYFKKLTGGKDGCRKRVIDLKRAASKGEWDGDLPCDRGFYCSIAKDQCIRMDEANEGKRKDDELLDQLERTNEEARKDDSTNEESQVQEEYKELTESYNNTMIDALSEDSSNSPSNQTSPSSPTTVISSPPTISPPTISPPTISPPTISPPTISPPTFSPPTISPPTISPPITQAFQYKLIKGLSKATLGETLNDIFSSQSVLKDYSIGKIELDNTRRYLLIIKNKEKTKFCVIYKNEDKKFLVEKNKKNVFDISNLKRIKDQVISQTIETNTDSSTDPDIEDPDIADPDLPEIESRKDKEWMRQIVDKYTSTADETLRQQKIEEEDSVNELSDLLQESRPFSAENSCTRDIEPYDDDTCRKTKKRMDFPHQDIVTKCICEKTHNQDLRILIASRTGSGKSRILWNLVEYFYSHQDKYTGEREKYARPIVIVAPSDEVKNTLQKEFMKQNLDYLEGSQKYNVYEDILELVVKWKIVPTNHKDINVKKYNDYPHRKIKKIRVIYDNDTTIQINITIKNNESLDNNDIKEILVDLFEYRNYRELKRYIKVTVKSNKNYFKTKLSRSGILQKGKPYKTYKKEGTPIRFLLISDLYDYYCRSPQIKKGKEILNIGWKRKRRENIDLVPENLTIFFDEAHNLLVPQNCAQRSPKTQQELNHLREKISNSINCNMTFLTATPLVRDPSSDADYEDNIINSGRRMQKLIIKNYDTQKDETLNKLEEYGTSSGTFIFIYDDLKPPLYPHINLERNMLHQINPNSFDFLVEKVEVDGVDADCQNDFTCNLIQKNNKYIKKPNKIRNKMQINYNLSNKNHRLFQPTKVDKRKADKSVKFNKIFDEISDGVPSLILIGESAGMRYMQNMYIDRLNNDLNNSAKDRSFVPLLVDLLQELNKELDPKVINKYIRGVTISDDVELYNSLSELDTNAVKGILREINKYIGSSDFDLVNKYTKIQDKIGTKTSIDWTIDFIYRQSTKRTREITDDIIDDFNKGRIVRRELKDGSEISAKLTTLVVNVEKFKEGVSFRPRGGVKRLIICNPPDSVKDFKQQIGRVLRACAYHIPGPYTGFKSTQTVDIKMYVTTPGHDEYEYTKLRGHYDTYQEVYKNMFKKYAIDYKSGGEKSIYDYYDQEKYDYYDEPEEPEEPDEYSPISGPTREQIFATIENLKEVEGGFKSQYNEICARSCSAIKGLLINLEKEDVDVTIGDAVLSAILQHTVPTTLHFVVKRWQNKSKLKQILRLLCDIYKQFASYGYKGNENKACHIDSVSELDRIDYFTNANANVEKASVALRGTKDLLINTLVKIKQDGQDPGYPDLNLPEAPKTPPLILPEAPKRKITIQEKDASKIAVAV